MTKGCKIDLPEVGAKPSAVEGHRRAPRRPAARTVDRRPGSPDALAHGLQDSDLRALARIDAALERIESGCYGYCVRCGAPIGGARLEVDPATALCLGCEPSA